MPNILYIIISIVAIAVIYASWLVYNRASTPEEESIVEYNDASNNGGVIIVEEFNAEQIAPKDESAAELSLPAEINSQITVTDETYQEPKNEEVKDTKEIKEVAKEIKDVKEVKDAKTAPPTDETSKENTAKKEVTAKAPVVVPNTGVFIEIVQESWIEVKDDTKLYISKVLQPGDSYTVPEGEGIILSVGKPEGVKVYINGVETAVVRPNKKMNIALDEFLSANR